jgi:competence protein ComEC
MQAPLVSVTVAFLLGILLGDAAAPHPAGLVVAGLMSAWAALWGRRRAKAKVVAILLLWLCLGALRMVVWERHPDAGLPKLLSDEPQPVQLHGLVVDDPVELFEPGEAPSPEDAGIQAGVEPAAPGAPDRQVCVLALQHVRLPVPEGPGPGGTGVGREAPWQPLHGRLRVTVYSPRQLVRYGDEVLVEGEWSTVPAPGNPGQYDWRASLARKRIHGLVRVRPFDGLVVLRRGQGNPVLAVVFRLRQRWVRLIEAHFGPQEAGLLLALLLGERAEIGEDLKRAFIETGTIHLLVISGFNVGLIAGLLELLLRLAGLPWRVRLCLSALGLGGYCLLTGMQPPVARATLMAWVVLGAYALDRVLSWSNTLAAAALIILWVNPTQLFDPGFQLSFGAVLSLLVFAGRWHGWFQARSPWLRPGWLRRYVAISVSATSAVWVGLAPLLAWHFHLIAPVSMLANVLVAPLVSALVAVGTALLMAATIVEEAAGWGAWVLTLLVDATVRCVAWCHDLPGGSWVVRRPGTLELVGYYGLLALSLLGGRLGWSPARVLISWLAGVAIWVWGMVGFQAMEARWLRVDVLDVGHGDSLVVRTPRRQTLLVDAGSPEAWRFHVAPFLRHEGIATLDALIVTHPDGDHLGGALPLLRELRVRRVVTNGALGETALARGFRSLVAAQGIEHTVVVAGMTIGAGDVEITVVHPPPGLVPGVAPESNDNSVVLRLEQGGVSFLLTGDLEEAGLPWLLRSPDPLRAAVLKVPHHGSRLGEAGNAFFDAVRPDLAILSVGRVHHLPAPETLEALSDTGAILISTREEGAIALRTDGVRLDMRAFKRSSQWRPVHLRTRARTRTIPPH